MRFVPIVLSIVSVSPAYACSPSADDATEADVFRKATYVFHALLVEAKLDDYAVGPPGEPKVRVIVQNRYELKNAVKGEPPASGIVTATTGIIGGCAPPLVVGQEYIFFVEPWPEDAPKEMKANSLGMIDIFGTQFLTGNPSTTEEELQRLRAYKN